MNPAAAPERASDARKPSGRYHHGDLRQALIDAGLEMAREGGPESVVLRAATRRAGVTANAAYRHFAARDALLHEVCTRAQSAVARAIEAELDQVDATDPVERARARFRAVGTGYIRFARSDPGLFRTAFFFPADLRRSQSEEGAGDSGRNPFQLLSDALDEMRSAGLLDAEARQGAEFVAWSAVHGLAILAISGPLRAMPAERIDDLTAKLVVMVEKGLIAGE
jgi:AcrR family transcriptional regulator